MKNHLKKNIKNEYEENFSNHQLYSEDKFDLALNWIFIKEMFR